ncbi:MAG: FAD-dependent oxidoreductase [Clostridiales bacterium]|jgi:ferredoxin-NADP reductase|nr:FAD-dependent oxidoreductase [Eubacteriales bacterium]MDH7565109.1 FAD-dependent oxidoreductase [Clostridiales bacterium]
MDIKEHKLAFLERRKEVDNIMTFIFKPIEKFEWKPGQHGIFINSRIAAEDGPQKVFTIASTPAEEIIMITTRIPEKPSAFKAVMARFGPGDAIMMKGPMGSFFLDSGKKPAILIAGGIGITPYRPMVLDWANHPQGPVELLYIEDKSSFVYRDEFDRVAKGAGLFKINYFNEREALSGKIVDTANRYANEGVYFVSGPPPMVEANTKLLKSLGIQEENIRTDWFAGY